MSSFSLLKIYNSIYQLKQNFYQKILPPKTALNKKSLKTDVRGI